MNNAPDDDESRQWLEDLLTLASIPHEGIVEISKELLAKNQGFASLENVTHKHIEDPEVRSAVLRLITNLDSDSIPLILEAVQAWKKSRGEEESMSDAQFSLLERNLKELVRRETEGVVRRSQKAAALTFATGNDITGLGFICDARPVYNAARSAIEGYVPLATMRIHFDRPNDDSDVIEFVLTPEEIGLLIDRATQARSKLSLMQKTFSAWLASGIEEDAS